MANRSTVIPDSKGEVQAKLLRFKQGGPSVEEARNAMIAGREAATTTGGGTKVPSFIKEAATRGQGGNVSADRPASSHEAFLASAKAKLQPIKARAAGRPINLEKMRDAGLISQDEIDALLADANGTVVIPAAPTVNVEDYIDSEEVIPAAAEPAVAPIAAAPARVAAEDGQARKVENSHFIGSIFREGKDWVAEIVYKNGSGTERFVANSKDDLMAKLLEGKGHGTVKVREVVKESKRRLLYGEENDTWDFFFKQVEESHGLTVDQYNALPEASRALVQDTVQAQQILAFQTNWPEYYATAKNFENVAKYLNKRNWPLTYRNLELAYKDLTADDELDLRPAARVDVAPQATPEVQAQPVAARVEDSTAPVAAPAAAVAPVVHKRGTSGIVPGSSSAASNEPAARAEDGTAQRVLSEKELRALPISELARIAKQTRKYGQRY